jgi:alkylation response protein AidB-like acyl-CoA dehydrogenase
VDFGFSEEQQDLQGLAQQILEGELSHERLKEVEGGDENFDRELWAKFGDAGVLGIALPEANGGGGYGFLETALVLEQIGRTVAPIPYYATVIAALPIAQFGSDAQRATLLQGVASGETIPFEESGTLPVSDILGKKRKKD